MSDSDRLSKCVYRTLTHSTVLYYTCDGTVVCTYRRDTDPWSKKKQENKKIKLNTYVINQFLNQTVCSELHQIPSSI